MALPCSPITVLTSSKSTLMRPCTLIISAIPETALCKTSSAQAKALSNSASSPMTSNNFSFKTTIKESTCCSNSDAPSSATFRRLTPSKSKGLLITPTVKIPISLATCATIGAAPVPVPPPIPAVMKTIWAPCKASAIRARASSAEAAPTSGLAPAPKPLEPNCKFTFASDRCKAPASVFIQMNSTPSTPRRIICWIALPPAPPIPTTLIIVLPATSCSTISNSINPPKCDIDDDEKN